MPTDSQELYPNELAAVLESLSVGVTVVDLDGRMRYYNSACAGLVDRKPEYIGRDIRACHRNPESIARIDQFLAEFKAGRREPFRYETVRNGRSLTVTFTPLLVDGRTAGCVQTIIPRS